ncbi:hypothetical protein FRACYDRAFT_272747 [Fragilariopsis cylindrus CCMP1102]|uniref:NIPSNAP domain-containing protein n=1 Tax=Fragilariopsis cylindrus CCMP1102 TaxID=635003 RepID=A0A1E7EKQ0_9STRA|nr:hypothetical protein FRACYDRAFT_272747 [Fragilariopsis cylindrus CCMP1102]|eukprot:OEU06499.1 hypothetical protein FRACYDRAFT_272747 [Fragilariopsis cylindrus CCMP1102]
MQILRKLVPFNNVGRSNNIIFNLVSRRMSSSNISSTPIIELREDTLSPQHVDSYHKATTEASVTRKELLPLRLFSLPETGGRLNVATHLYYFQGGFQERNERRKAMGTNNPDWKVYLQSVQPFLVDQKSTIFVEAPLVSEIEGVCGLTPGNIEQQLYDQQHSDDDASSSSSDESILELRRYQLKLGYDTVPKFLELYRAGLPSKLTAPGTDPSTSLVTLLSSEVGQLNEVMEVWRHGSTNAMEQSRVAARGATEWKQSIAKIASLATVFTSTIHTPLSFSPLK